MVWLLLLLYMLLAGYGAWEAFTDPPSSTCVPSTFDNPYTNLLYNTRTDVPACTEPLTKIQRNYLQGVLVDSNDLFATRVGLDYFVTMPETTYPAQRPLNVLFPRRPRTCKADNVDCLKEHDGRWNRPVKVMAPRPRSIR